MLACLVLMAIGMFMVTTVKQIPELEVWRFVTGLGIGGLLAASNAVAAEFSNLRRRSLCVALMAVGYPIGAVIGGSIVKVLLRDHDWRAVFYLGGSVTALFIPLVLLIVPESVHWLAHKQPSNALQRINKALVRMGHAAIEALPAIALQVGKRSVSDIFAPALLAITILSTLTYFFHIMTFYFLLKWIPRSCSTCIFRPRPARTCSCGPTWAAPLEARCWTAESTGRIEAAHDRRHVVVHRDGRPVRAQQPRPDRIVMVVRRGGILHQRGHRRPICHLCTGVPNTRARHGHGIRDRAGAGRLRARADCGGYLFKWGYTLPTVATYMALGSLLAAGILALLPSSLLSRLPSPC